MTVDLFFVSYGTLWLLVLANTFLLVATLRTNGILLTRLPNAGALVLSDQGPSVGELLPTSELPVAPPPGSLLLVFLSTDCALCRRIAPAVGTLHRPGVNRMILVKADDGDTEDIFRLVGFDSRAFTFADRTAFDRLGIRLTPFAILLDGRRRVVSKGIVNSREQLESLLETTTERIVSI